MGIWNSIKNAAKSVGKFVKKNWKTIVGVAAAVAIPFAAPVIGGMLAGSAFLASVAPGVATFLGSSLGAGVIGAGLGAGAAAVTGQNPLLGAALGGLGGYGGALMGAGGLFGGAAGPTVPATGGIIDIGGATGVDAATGYMLGGSASGYGLAGAGAAASAAAPASLGNIASTLAANPKSIGALAQLAMVMFNKDMTELTDEEKARLEEAAQQAATNRVLFEQMVEEARKVMQMGTPNPEQAYANARFSADAQFDEARRGMPVGLQEANDRKAAIEATKLGTQGVASDYVQAAAIRKVGSSMLPTMAPEGYAGLALPIYEDLYSRRNDYAEQMNKAVGGLFGSLA